MLPVKYTKMALKTARPYLSACMLALVKSLPVRALNSWRLHKLVRQGAEPICLHLGCGPRRLEGWINIDIAPNRPMPDILLDLEKGLPLPDSTVDYVYSEDLIEHLDWEKGRYLLSDCSRVLKSGGVMRILTPDLQAFALDYINESQDTLVWFKDECGCATFGEMFNVGMRAWGHKFLYDQATLIQTLTRFGLEVRKVSYNDSQEQILRGLDLRDSATAVYNTMYFDCYKLS